jgi:hypothetical protein
LNKYICFHKSNQYEVEANTSLEAQTKCATEHKIRKAYEVAVYLHSVNGEPVVHSTTEI